MNEILSSIDTSELNDTTAIQSDIKELQKVLEEPISNTTTSSNLTAEDKATLYAEKQKKVEKIKQDIKMKSSGFTEDATIGGYVFPGVDINKIRKK